MSRRTAFAVAMAFACGALPSAAAADVSFAGLAGTWSGSGQVRLANGATEAIKCKAYYTAKEGDRLGLAIRCAAPSYKLEFRAQLAQQGSKVSGSWEERTFNAGGTVSGQSTGSRLSLAVTGNVNASMSVSYSRSSQSVAISAEGVGFKSVSISLGRG